MRLVLYSGGQERSNHLIHGALFRLMPKGHRRSMTYVPFCEDGSEVYFRRAKKRYEKFGFRKFRCLPVDQDLSRKEISDALKSDVIYLAGGNTFYFLKHLKRNAMLPRLRKFAERGGVLAGLSAGALILSPSIHLAGYPAYNADENEVGLKDLRALNLVPFEFFPHYVNSKKLSDALLSYSRKTKHFIVGCPDGNGLVIHGDLMTFFGHAYLFRNGQKIRLRSLWPN